MFELLEQGATFTPSTHESLHVSNDKTYLIDFPNIEHHIKVAWAMTSSSWFYQFGSTL